MRHFRRMLLAGFLVMFCAMPTHAQSTPREPTDVYIRRMAGLPPETAKGEIKIIDVGHDPLSTMLSIVGNRTSTGWVVSYACAMSPHCAAHADKAAKAYTLSAPASAEVDQILQTLKSGREPDGQLQSPAFIGGQLLVAIDYQGFKREYRRVGMGGKMLGTLEALLSPPNK